MVDSTSTHYEAFTFARVAITSFLNKLGLIYLSGGLYGEFILYFFV